MDQVPANPGLEHHADRLQFRLPLPDGVAHVDYSVANGQIVSLDHSYVPPALRGQGAGEQLVIGCFEWLQAHGQVPVLRCSYIRRIADKHPHWRAYFGQGR